MISWRLKTVGRMISDRTSTIATIATTTTTTRLFAGRAITTDSTESSEKKNETNFEDEEYERRDKEFRVERKILNQSLKQLERFGFTRENIRESARSLGFSASAAESIGGKRDRGTSSSSFMTSLSPEAKLVESCLEEMDEKCRQSLKKRQENEDIVEKMPETQSEMLERILMERIFMVERYADVWPGAVLVSAKAGPSFQKRAIQKRLEIAEDIVDFVFSRDYEEDSPSSKNSLMKQADITAIAGILSLGETLVTVDFSRDREMTKEKLIKTIKVFLDTRMKVSTAQAYASSWPALTKIISNLDSTAIKNNKKNLVRRMIPSIDSIAEKFFGSKK